MKLRVLCPIGSEALRRRAARLIATPNVLVSEEEPSPALWAHLARDSYDLILTTATDLPQPLPEFVEAMRALPEHPEVVILTPDADPSTHAELIAVGALGVVYTRLPDRTLRPMFRALLRRLRTQQETQVFDGEQVFEPRLSDFVSKSLAMQQLLEMASRVADADTPILILGETGTGKEWLARSIHAASARGDGPFVPVNCAAMPEGLFESELFGHVEGAFTGAVRSRRGHFELAHGGTLFLDELGDMPLSLQAKLLRAVQDGRIRPVGGEEAIRFETRIITATNRDLEEAIRQREFRRDLFYRVGVITLTVPPLRERRADIPELARNYLDRFAIEVRRPVTRIGREAMAVLRGYSWPGNVRELINAMERAVLLCRGEELTVADLPRRIVEGRRAPAAAERTAEFDEAWLDSPLAEVRTSVVTRVEREYLIRTLRHTEGRIGAAARRSGLATRTLYNKLQRYRIRKEDFKL